MGTAKDDALNIANKLAAAHAAADTEELQDLHIALDEGLTNHGAALGLSEDDAAEIRGVLGAARGGTPKQPSPE